MVIGQNNKSENNDNRHLNGEVCFEKNLWLGITSMDKSSQIILPAMFS